MRKFYIKFVLKLTKIPKNTVMQTPLGIPGPFFFDNLSQTPNQVRRKGDDESDALACTLWIMNASQKRDTSRTPSAKRAGIK